MIALLMQKTAIRWIRHNAVEFDVNPSQIVASGGSSGVT